MRNIAIVGTGSRAEMYISSLCRDYKDSWSIKALVDSNPGRLEYYRNLIVQKFGRGAPILYAPEEFEKAIKADQVDLVIVVSIDRSHDEYIDRAMRAGCDVITEKPLTIDAPRLARIRKAMEETGRSLRVGFNYRYAPRNSKVKEVLSSGAIGKIHSLHFEWLLDTSHGADYFRRWHRDKRNSGGLMVHKSTHHFDLVNWWLDDLPRTVFASGDLSFYGRENAEKRGQFHAYNRGTGNADKDPFALDLARDPNLKALYLNVEEHDGYRRDENVFGDFISIEDDIAVIVEYEGGARMSYHLTAYSPYEGFRICFNGDAGRLEYEVIESTYVSGSSDDINRVDNVERATSERASLRLIPHWKEAQEIELEESTEGGHGGGDARLLEDLFGETGAPDPLGRAAGIEAGSNSIGVGIAANISMKERRLVHVKEILDWR